MLVVATYLWGDKYTPADVRRLKDMVRAHLSIEHEFAVITDKPELFAADLDIRAIPIDWTTHVPGTCFVRLMTFHPDGASIIGERVLQIDLDTIIVGDIDPLVKRDENLVLWRNPSRIPWDNPAMKGRPYYNTSVVLHRCGTMRSVWEEFLEDKKLGFRRSRDDQWFLSSLLGGNMPYFDGNDGIYRLGRPDTPGSGVVGVLPENARIVTFPGSEGKWTEPHIAAANPWIAECLSASSVQNATS